MSLTWDPCNVLGVNPSASSEEIKRTYRYLARQCHPDRVGSQGEEQFRAITAAYEVLGDPEKRQLWDAKFAQQQGTEQVQQAYSPGSQSPRIVVKTQSPGSEATAGQIKQVRDLLKARQLMAAVHTAEHLRSQFPQDPKVRHLMAVAYYRLGEAYVLRGHQDLGHPYLLKAMQTDPEDASILFDVKRALSRLGKPV